MINAMRVSAAMQCAADRNVSTVKRPIESRTAYPAQLLVINRSLVEKAAAGN
jgi:hypothetical protein